MLNNNEIQVLRRMMESPASDRSGAYVDMQVNDDGNILRSLRNLGYIEIVSLDQVAICRLTAMGAVYVATTFPEFLDDGTNEATKA